MGNNAGAGIKEKLKHEGGSNATAHRRGVDKDFEEVRKRLGKAYPEKGQNEIRQLALDLSDHERMKERWFGHLLKITDQAVEHVKNEASDFEKAGGFHNQSERRKSGGRIRSGLQPVQSLEVRLLLYELKDETVLHSVAKVLSRYMDNFMYGPFHAALQIGDVILDWGPGSLVVPRFQVPASECETQDAANPQPIFDASVHIRSSDPVVVVNDIPLRTGAERTREFFINQIKIAVDISQEKKSLIDEVVLMAVKYNTKFDFGLFSCNCQYFVVDVLSSLGITDPENTFEGKLKQHRYLLTKRGETVAVEEFNSHQELDDHVRQHLDTMEREDLEFCHCHYLLFHSWGVRRPSEGAWHCDHDTCQHSNIKQHLHIE